MTRACVDVLIVSHNSQLDLANCLDSLKDHLPGDQGPAVTVRVYDNASTDGTAEMVRARFPEALLHAAPHNRGFAHANNVLAADSDADFLMLLNPDTVFERDVISPLVQELQDHPEAVLAAPRIISPDGSPQLSCQSLPSLRYELSVAIRHTKLSRAPWLRRGEETIHAVRQEGLAQSPEPRTGEFIWATCWLVRNDWVKQHGLFNPDFRLYDEDLDFCARARSSGVQLRYVPGIELIHIGGASSTPRSKRRLMEDARAKYYRVHQGAAASLVYRYLILPLGRFKFANFTRSVDAPDPSLD